MSEMENLATGHVDNTHIAMSLPRQLARKGDWFYLTM